MFGVSICLQATRWDLGTCVPDDLLRQLLARQKKIENICLTTDHECGTNVETQYWVDLARLTELKSLTWIGLNRYDDFESVRKCIAVNGKGIRALTLDLIDWETAEYHWSDVYRVIVGEDTAFPDNFFAKFVLGTKPGEQKCQLTSLEYLSLHSVSCQFAAPEMAYALNMSKLHTLKLWNCPYSLDMLLEVISTAQTLKYKSLELVVEPRFVNADEESTHPGRHDATVAAFLKVIEGLEDLYLLLPDWMDWNVVAQGLLQHVSTLRRLVVHARGCYDSAMQVSDGIVTLEGDVRRQLYKIRTYTA